jgi:hypothetical protein
MRTNLFHSFPTFLVYHKRYLVQCGPILILFSSENSSSPKALFVIKSVAEPTYTLLADPQAAFNVETFDQRRTIAFATSTMEDALLWTQRLQTSLDKVSKELVDVIHIRLSVILPQASAPEEFWVFLFSGHIVLQKIPLLMQQSEEQSKRYCYFLAVSPSTASHIIFLSPTTPVVAQDSPGTTITFNMIGCEKALPANIRILGPNRAVTPDANAVVRAAFNRCKDMDGKEILSSDRVVVHSTQSSNSNERTPSLGLGKVTSLNITSGYQSVNVEYDASPKLDFVNAGGREKLFWWKNQVHNKKTSNFLPEVLGEEFGSHVFEAIWESRFLPQAAMWRENRSISCPTEMALWSLVYGSTEDDKSRRELVGYLKNSFDAILCPHIAVADGGSSSVIRERARAFVSLLDAFVLSPVVKAIFLGFNFSDGQSSSTLLLDFFAYGKRFTLDSVHPSVPSAINPQIPQSVSVSVMNDLISEIR